jgi:hypothetical protein
MTVLCLFDAAGSFAPSPKLAGSWQRAALLRQPFFLDQKQKSESQAATQGKWDANTDCGNTCRLDGVNSVLMARLPLSSQQHSWSLKKSRSGATELRLFFG